MAIAAAQALAPQFLLLALLGAGELHGGYSNLLITADSRTVYFSARTGSSATTGYRMDLETGKVTVTSQPVSDISARGDVLAFARFGGRICGTSGSSCFLAPGCSASFLIQGQDFESSGSRLRTFVRLDRSGKRAFITQDFPCSGIGQPAPPPLNGLYEADGLKLTAGSNNVVSANQRPGRRVITERGEVLTLSGKQLQWIGSSGVRNVTQSDPTTEAVTDAEGVNVVYVEEGTAELHWIAEMDRRMELKGSAPALTDDGSVLVFLDSSGAMQVYDRDSKTTRRLSGGPFTEFTLGNRMAFAATQDSRLVLVELESGTQTELLGPYPEVFEIDAVEEPLFVVCPLVCYGPQERRWWAAPGTLLVLRGQFLDLPRWRARTAVTDYPVYPYNSDVAATQFPSASFPFREPIRLYHPDHPVQMSIPVDSQRVVTCLGTLHENYDRLVTSDDPARSGEVIHIYVTGLQGVEAVPDNTPNPNREIAVASPPQLADPGLGEVVAFRLAPNLIGTQQLDLRISRASNERSLFANLSLCAPPPVQ